MASADVRNAVCNWTDLVRKVMGRPRLPGCKNSRGAWKQNPNLKICWLIGYAEHANDVKFYEQIRQMNDPRFEWLDSRVGLDPTSSWLLPGPQGEKRPLAFFGPRISHWDQFYRQPIENIRRFAERTRSDGLYGYIPAFEPGFGTASYYGDQVPFPVDILPYCLTGFVYRETTWDPGIGTAELHDRIQRRYFSSDSPKRLGEDLAYLHQFSIDYAEVIKTFATGRLGYSGERIALLSVLAESERVRGIAVPEQRRDESARLAATFKKLIEVEGHLKKMSEIESHAAPIASTGTPKTVEGIGLLLKMISDTRKFYAQAVPDRGTLREELEKLTPTTR